jgi:hypothetical protein
MIQVGSAWRLVEAPTPGAAPPDPVDDKSGGAVIKNSISDNPKVQKLVEELTALDKNTPPADASANAAAVVQHHLKRADLLERIVAEVKPEDRDPWIRQVADSLCTAAQANPKEAAPPARLVTLEKQLAAVMPAANLTAYVTYREMQADNAARISNRPQDLNKVQQEWVDRLSKFVETFPKAEDTPDALLQLGMANEFLSKEVDAKNWYARLARDFADKPQGVKAAGAVRRLGLEGQPLKLAGPLLGDPNTTFDVEQMRGKVVVVYYWASWNDEPASDFTKLKRVLDANGKDVALLCVNLDSSAEEARKAVSRLNAPGTHLYQAGGLEGKLATDYGILGLPNLFLVGKDGKVLSRTLQINNVEDEVKKQLK